jgi:hypothetical protein
MLYVGSMSKAPDRDSSWTQAFYDLGWEVSVLSTDVALSGPMIMQRIKRRFSAGVEYRRLVHDLFRLIESKQPQWVHFRLPVEFSRSVIARIKSKGIVVTEYFNDDAFSSRAPLGYYCKFRRALPEYDGHFVFREHNVRTYLDAGATFAQHCPPTYDPTIHQDSRNRGEPFLADAAFIGHWEGDQRTLILESLCSAGISLVLRGGMWDIPLRGLQLEKETPVKHAFGKEYNYIYANVMAGLCFFSKINNDTWTRRALEIVAVGGLLVCERTDEAQTYFIDRQEAFFFSSAKELIDIVTLLKQEPALREKVRLAGYQRLMQSSHTIGDRAVQIDHFVKHKLAQGK